MTTHFCSTHFLIPPFNNCTNRFARLFIAELYFDVYLELTPFILQNIILNVLVKQRFVSFFIYLKIFLNFSLVIFAVVLFIIWTIDNIKKINLLPHKNNDLRMDMVVVKTRTTFNKTDFVFFLLLIAHVSTNLI